jgi:hypothetical protein
MKKEQRNPREEEGEGGLPVNSREEPYPSRYIKNTLDTDKTVRREITSIRSFNQELFSISTEKDCLTSYYDKCRMLNNIECEPFGFITQSPGGGGAGPK